MRVLVTGGAGFIGSKLVAALLSKGETVTVLDDFSTGSKSTLEVPSRSLKVVQGDVAQHASRREALVDVRAVVHLAAVSSVPLSFERPDQTRRTNVRGTQGLLLDSLRAGATRFVFASTSAVYGSEPIVPIPEGAPCAPTSPYALSKLKAEASCREFANEFLDGLAILRFFNVYGAGQRGTVIAEMSDRLSHGLSARIEGDGLQTRDFVYVEDAVEASMIALKTNKRGTFNIGTGRECAILQVEAILQKLLLGGEHIEPTFVPPREGDALRSVADTSKAASVLGFRAGTSLEAGLQSTVGSCRVANSTG